MREGPRAHSPDTPENFGLPKYQGKPKKIGNYHLPEFRDLLDTAAPHMKGNFSDAVRELWEASADPLEVIACYNTMRTESWREGRVTWRTVANYFPDWKYRKDRGIVTEKKETNGKRASKYRSIAELKREVDEYVPSFLGEPGLHEDGFRQNALDGEQDPGFAGLLTP